MGRGSVCGRSRGKTSGNFMTISALAYSMHSSSAEGYFVIIRENDFVDIAVVLGDSVTVFRVADSGGKVS